MKTQYLIVILLQAISISHAILVEENGKDLPNNYNFDILARRRRPFAGGTGGAGCNFNGIRGKPKTDASGRTFFDLQFVNVGYNYNYDIHCGGGGNHPGGGGAGAPIGGINKPILQKPHKPLLGALLQQGGSHENGGDHQGGGLLGNRPILSAIFGQSQSQSQSQSGAFSEAISGITSLLPKPQDIGQGFGEGISSFISTLPHIGQSFQSLLPSFDNFQFPTLPSFPSLFQGGQVAPTIPVTQPPSSGAGVVTPVGPDPVTEPPDPDDIIYNDGVKPVHEDHDPVTDPHITNKLPPGVYFNRNYDQIRYQASRNYRNQMINSNANQNRFHYQQSRDLHGTSGEDYVQGRGNYRSNEGRSRYNDGERSRGRGFRFPS